MTDVRAVAFDLGDTLWHFPYPRSVDALTRAHVRRLRAVLAHHGGDPSAAEALQARLIAGWDEWERDADERGAGGPDYIAETARVAAEHDLPDTRGAAEAIWQAMALGGPFLGRRLFEETHDTLDWLRNAGYRLAIVTNRAHGDGRFVEELHAYGLRDPFEVIISSDQVGYRKPHPRIFEFALEALGLAPAEVAMVGDRPSADIAGARRIGMPSIWIRKAAPPDRAPASEAELPDYTIDELRELRTLDLLRR